MAPAPAPPLLLLLLLLLGGCGAEVYYAVYPAETNPTCQSSAQKPGHLLPEAAAAGTCVSFGKGMSAFNSIEVISCSSRCLCFTQVASEGVDTGCDTEAAVGSNVKQACFDECLADCNGSGCGATATLESTITRLALVGEGQICAEPLPDAEYTCATTGMVQAPADSNTTDKSGDNSAAAALVASRSPLLTLAAAALLTLLVPFVAVFQP